MTVASDYGVALNKRIAAAQARIAKLAVELYEAEGTLEDLRADRESARSECSHCNDCSMCIA